MTGVAQDLATARGTGIRREIARRPGTETVTRIGSEIATGIVTATVIATGTETGTATGTETGTVTAPKGTCARKYYNVVDICLRKRQ